MRIYASAVYLHNLRGDFADRPEYIKQYMSIAESHAQLVVRYGVDFGVDWKLWYEWMLASDQLSQIEKDKLSTFKYFNYN